MRLAVNIGEVAIEELGQDVSFAAEADRGRTPARAATQDAAGDESRGDAWEPPREADAGPPERFRGRDTRPTEAQPGDQRAMSEEQRKFLFRLAFELGESRETARDRVLKALGVERLEWATRPMASRAIDELKREVASRGNGASGGNGGGNGRGQHPEAAP